MLPEGVPSRISEISALVPPMSSVRMLGSPAAEPIDDAATTPPAGPAAPRSQPPPAARPGRGERDPRGDRALPPRPPAVGAHDQEVSAEACSLQPVVEALEV